MSVRNERCWVRECASVILGWRFEVKQTLEEGFDGRALLKLMPLQIKVII